MSCDFNELKSWNCNFQYLNLTLDVYAHTLIALKSTVYFVSVVKVRELFAKETQKYYECYIKIEQPLWNIQCSLLHGARYSTRKGTRKVRQYQRRFGHRHSH